MGMVADRTRLPASTFDLPVEKMAAGYYTDAYFNHTRATLLADGKRPHVLTQVFQKKHAILSGIDEAVAILTECSDAGWSGDGGLVIHALHEGDRISPGEMVMTIEGDYTAFAHLETLYLGALSRRTLIATNTLAVLEAANGKPIIFMPARHDHWKTQTGDGYAAYVAGQVAGAPIGVTTEDQASWWGGTALGTVPHSLIAAYGGDTVRAAEAFARWADPSVNITVLVDFDNDSVQTALDVADALGDRLWGVRIDTSETMIDRSCEGATEGGVTPELVQNVRDGLDREEFGDVRIVVSGGFGVEKITRFEKLGSLVDAYGVGLSLIRGANDFTADIVKPVAKVGRTYKPNTRLERV
jgi:nicotinate phosphoribosyltransferase